MIGLLFGAGRAFFNKYKISIYVFIAAAFCSVCFYAGIGFNKNSSDLKIANLTMMHSAQLQLIKDANQLAIDERQSHINHLQEEFAIADQNYLENINHVKAENDRLNACLKSGKCVQRAKIKAPVCSDAGGKAADQQGADGAVYAELDPEVAAGARRVSDDADQIIMSCNQLKDKIQACVDKGLCWIKFI